jgi:hypothetical protein
MPPGKITHVEILGDRMKIGTIGANYIEFSDIIFIRIPDKSQRSAIRRPLRFFWDCSCFVGQPRYLLGFHIHNINVAPKG